MAIGKHATSLPSVAKGGYDVKFEDFWPLDEDKLPTLADSGKQIRYHVYIMGGPEDGHSAPGSMDATEENLKRLVAAFGGDPSKISWDLEDVGTMLTLATAIMKKAAKVIKAFVGEKGWVSSLEGMNTPKGSYLFQFGNITSKDNLGQFSWVKRNGMYGETFRVNGYLEIVGDGPLKGSRPGFSLDYPFVVNPETGQAAWKVNQKQELVKASQRWDSFFKAFGVDLETFDIESVVDQHNLVPEMLDLLKKSKVVVAGEVNEGGWVDINKITPLPTGVSVNVKVDDVTKAKKVLFEVIDREVKASTNADAFDEDGVLTDEGRLWSKEHIKPITKDIGMRSAKFDEMTFDNIREILNRLGFTDDAKKLDQ